MAGTFTHWMVAEEALDRLSHLPEKYPLSPTILKRHHFVCLGAVSPDYPYLTELAGRWLKKHSWADRMHYENTGVMVRNGILALPPPNTEAFSVCLSWLCGFAAHLVTDSVVHPVVQATVGPYLFNPGEHCHCELTQDAFIFHAIKGVELGYSEYVDLFAACSHPEERDRLHPDLSDFWNRTLRATYSTATGWFNKIDPDSWHEHFLSRMDAAADPPPLFRHIAAQKGLAYKKSTDITAEELQRFVREVRLPGNRTGDFQRDVFDKAVDEVVAIWERLLIGSAASPGGEPVVILRNCNLDTGVDEDQQVYWS